MPFIHHQTSSITIISDETVVSYEIGVKIETRTVITEKRTTDFQTAIDASKAVIKTEQDKIDALAQDAAQAGLQVSVQDKP